MLNKNILTAHWELRPATIFAIGLFAIVAISALWIAGVDGGAMKMLLASLVFSLTCYAAYVSDTSGGEVSYWRGYLVGGLTMLVFVPWVACKHSYETRGIPLPSSFFELLVLGIGLLIFVPFGAAVGAMTAVIGGRVLRAIGSLARRLSAPKGGPGRRKTSKDASLDDPFEWGYRWE